MAQITTTVANGVSSTPKREGQPYYRAFTASVTANSVTGNRLMSPVIFQDGTSQSINDIHAYDTWAEVLAALGALSIDTFKLKDPNA